jgi:tripartite-type tricarboxylate transporter receptor subunit TctC
VKGAVWKPLNWQGIVVPAKTPRVIVERLNCEIIAVLALPAMIDVLNAQGLDPAGTTPAQFDKLIRSEIDRWTRLVKTAGIKVE